MTIIDRNTVEKIAHLARLKISEEQIPNYLKNFSNIIHFVEQINAADTTDVLPMSHPLHMNQPLRPDAITENNERTLYQDIAPSVESGLYLVPQVIE